ncbi:MAG: AMP-binding protein [Treponema sp.]|nr:AMP-binding protein [Treponema sp.]
MHNSATIQRQNGLNYQMVDLKKMTLTELCLRSAEKYKNRRAFQIYRDGQIYAPISYRMMGIRSRQFGMLLQSLGVQPGDRVMILAENCPEWPIAWFGIAFAGAVAVPVLTDFPTGQIKTIGEHSGATVLCVTERTAPKAEELDPAIPRIQIDGPMTIAPVTIQGIRKELFLKEINPQDDEQNFPRREEDDPAAIIYTSGTTGKSKGVTLSNRNLIFNAQSSNTVIKLYPRDRFLSIIPIAHTYECSIGFLTAVISGSSTTYLDKPPSPAVLLPAIQAIRPTVMLTVPLIIEKTYRGKVLPALRSNPLYKFPLTRPLARKVAGKKLMSAFGGSIRFFGIGGAPLSPDVEDFLRLVKFPYSLGYGLTETAPLIAGAPPFHFPAHSVGPVLPGVKVRITGGEIQVQGPNVMLGYYRDTDETAKVFTDDGWLKTGDLGYLDPKGQLYIKGRSKALILGPSGENIYPEEIEALLTASPLAEDALVYADSRGTIMAMITLKAAAAAEPALQAIAGIGAALEELKKKVNKQLPSFSRLSQIVIHSGLFEKTPTGKIRRFLYQTASI